MLSGAFLQIHLVCSVVLEGSLYAQWSFMDQLLCQVCSVVLDGSVAMPMIGFCVIFWTVRFFLVVLAGRLQLPSAVFGHGLDLLSLEVAGPSHSAMEPTGSADSKKGF